MPNARRFCFTLNNPTDGEVAALDNLDGTVRYLVYGREVGDSGTPHLQGFVIFNNATTLAAAKRRIGERAHLEVARGTSKQASDYCKKDGDFAEYGDLPANAGKRNDWEAYKQWVESLGRVPSKVEVLREWPSLYARYRRAVFEYAEAIAPPPVLVQDEPRFGWQSNLAAHLDTESHPREIRFIIDPEGNSGKSWFCKYAITKYPDRVQVLRIGKRDDLAYCIDIDRDIFLFDIPRNQMKFLQYSVLESLKDQMIFSPKYESSFKVLRSVPKVIVFGNEQPDMNEMSQDRYKIINI